MTSEYANEYAKRLERALEVTKALIEPLVTGHIAPGKPKGKLTHWEVTTIGDFPITATFAKIGEGMMKEMPMAIAEPLIMNGYYDICFFIAAHPDVAEELLHIARAEHAKRAGVTNPEDLIKNAAKAGGETKEGD